MEELATVYARSLFDVARDHGKLDVIAGQLAAFTDALADSEELRVFLYSPYFSTSEIEAGLGKLLTGPDELFSNFLALLVEKRRMPALPLIRLRFEALLDQANNVLPVAVTSAIALDDQDVKGIGERIAQQTGQRVELTSNVDPDILGGIVLRVGNSILDASIRNRLEQLRKEVARA
jgi:F-type H+-transporting ATPase subunit delta